MCKKRKTTKRQFVQETHRRIGSQAQECGASKRQRKKHVKWTNIPIHCHYERNCWRLQNMEVTFYMDTNKDPHHAKPYRIPVSQINLRKRVINEMVKNKALSEYNGNSLCVVPTFGVPTENDGVQVVSNFWKVNEAIKRIHWPIPTIQDMLHQYGGMTYATALDMIMSYYAMNIRED